MTTTYKQSLADRAEQLHPWFYEVKIGGKSITPGLTPAGINEQPPEVFIKRQAQRQTLLVDELLSRTDLCGASILDVGCNCGYWSSQYVLDYGAELITGVDGRQLFIDQAELYFESLDIADRGRFHLANVADLDFIKHLGAFDFVLCAGLLYHVKEPVALLRRLAETGAGSMLVDTRVAVETRTVDEPEDKSFNGIPGARRKTVLSLTELLGTLSLDWATVTELPVHFETRPGDDYHEKNRVAILCCR